MLTKSHDLILEKNHIIGVISVSSLDFINTVFNCFNQNQTVVFLRDERDRYKIEATGIKKILTPDANFGWYKGQFLPQKTDGIAQISFTSGTTGQPKGVLLTHRALNDVVERLIEIMEIDSTIREYIGVPVNYSFGFGRCRVVATVGGQFYLPENGFNPLEIRDMLLKGSINAISAVPSLWRTLFDCRDLFGQETHQVRWIEIGSQYMSREEKEQLYQLFPQANIVQHYGLTEASRSTFLRIDQIEGEYLESVGKPYGNTEIQLSPDQTIMIRGDHVAKKLLINGEIKPNIDENGWHTTNDLGSLKEGYLYYLGRADDLINCGGIKVSPDYLEKLIRDNLKIQSGIAVARVKDSLRGEAILVAILKSAKLDPYWVKNVAIEAIKTEYNLLSGEVIKIMELTEFPMTATGKIQRNQLSELYTEEKEAFNTSKQEQSSEKISLTPQEAEIIAIWQSILNIKQIDPDSNFYELGGDSLTAIAVMVKMEKLGIPKPIVQGMLQGLSVRELAHRMESSADLLQSSHCLSNQYAQTSMTINIVRGLLVLCVISGHWSEGILNKLPSFIAMGLKPLLSPLFSAGTPGFAIIYGVTAGYAMFTIFQSDRRRLQKILLTTFGLLTLGILIIALMNLGQKVIQGEGISLTDFTNSFYSVLTYYWLITLTLPLWFSLLIKSSHPAIRAVLLSLILYSGYYYFLSGLTAYSAQGWTELAKLMISAKYSYINLAAGTLSGIAIGTIIRENIKNKPIPLGFIEIGLAFVTAGLVVCSHAGMSQTWLEWPQPKTFLWGWFFYLGLVLISLAITQLILNRYNHFSSGVKFLLQALATIGILAFPLFVTHEMVIPVKEILVTLGLPNSFSLIIPILLFLGGLTLMFKKVHSANFIWSNHSS